MDHPPCHPPTRCRMARAPSAICFLRMTGRAGLLLLALVGSAAGQSGAQVEDAERRLILVTLDGLRGEEVFQGADRRLMTADAGKVREPEQLADRYWRDAVDERRAALMPFLWSEVAREGQLFGDPAAGCEVRVTNGKFFSYPGYSELLTGFADERIDSNAKVPNPNMTVLEWLARDPDFSGRIAAYCSWDVFPFILNAQRSGLRVNAGWQPLSADGTDPQLAELDRYAAEMPRVWHNVRYDYFTFRGALHCLKTEKPRVLYVALGETDDWAHEGRYDLYLEAARRNDSYLSQLWEHVQSDPEYAGRTAMVVTTDHGRGDGREGWKSHGVDHAGSERIWIAVLGAGVPATGIRADCSATQAQIAATCARLLARDYCAAEPRAAPPLPFEVNVAP